MITQEEFVADCHLEYAILGLEPGNPEHGNWHKAHYPLPKCLGGSEWVWLLVEHHAVQGVLQSIEFQHPCVWTWERQYIVGRWSYLSEEYEFWCSERGRLATRSGMNLDPVWLSKRGYLGGRAGKGRRKKPGHRVGKTPASALQKATATRRNIERGLERWQCTITGFVSTDSGLTRYQRNRSIDTSNRIRLY